MDKKQFLAKMFYTLCEDCPIADYCKDCHTISCLSTAAKYYNREIQLKGVFVCPTKSTDTKQKTF